MKIADKVMAKYNLGGRKATQRTSVRASLNATHNFDPLKTVSINSSAHTNAFDHECRQTNNETSQLASADKFPTITPHEQSAMKQFVSLENKFNESFHLTQLIVSNNKGLWQQPSKARNHKLLRVQRRRETQRV